MNEKPIEDIEKEYIEEAEKEEEVIFDDEEEAETNEEIVLEEEETKESKIKDGTQIASIKSFVPLCPVCGIRLMHRIHDGVKQAFCKAGCKISYKDIKQQYYKDGQ